MLEVIACSKHKYSVKRKTKSSKNSGKFKLSSHMNKKKKEKHLRKHSKKHFGKEGNTC